MVENEVPREPRTGDGGAVLAGENVSRGPTNGLICHAADEEDEDCGGCGAGEPAGDGALLPPEV